MVMDITGKTFSLSKKKETKESVLADEIYEAMGKRIKYPVIRKLINEKGYQAAYWNFRQVMQAGAYNRAGLFLTLMAKEKVVFKTKQD